MYVIIIIKILSTVEDKTEHDNDRKICHVHVKNKNYYYR